MSELQIDLSAIFEAHPFALELLEALQAEGHEAVIVGGMVRDAVRATLHENINYEPIEVDIATSAKPDEIKRLFSEYTLVEVGAAFGVLIVRSPEGIDYEVATYRSESDYDGRRPGSVVHVGALIDDVLRRDFTVNGLAVRLDGQVIDYVGGIEDLKNHHVRAIGDADLRFREDFLRMLRAVRFTALLKGTLDESAQTAIRRHASDLRKISAERIRDELMRMLALRNSSDAIKLLDELELLEEIFPELVRCKGTPQPEEFHPEGDVYTHTLLALEQADLFMEDARVKLALLLHDIGKPIALEQNEGVNAAGHDAISAELSRKICKRLRFSSGDTKFIASLVAEHQRIGHFPSMNRAKQVRFIKAHENEAHTVGQFSERYYWFKCLLQLMVADCQASAMKSRGWLSVITAVRPLLLYIEDLEKRIEGHQLINGHDLIELGIPKGPQIGKILDELYEMIYAGDIESRGEALRQAKVLMEKLSDR